MASKRAVIWMSVIFLLISSFAPSEVNGTFFKRVKGEREEDKNPGVLVKLKTGMEMAGKILGLDRASSVAQLVMDAFKQSPRQINYNQGEHKPQPTISGGFLASFLRLLSFDTSKISAVVMNTIIFLAQLITTSLVPKNPAQLETPRKVRDGTPIEWITSNPSRKLQNLLQATKDKDLPEKMIETLRERSENGDDTSCVQLLVCKTAPFVWGMQRALAAMGKINNDTSPGNEDNLRDRGRKKSPLSALFQYLPDVSELVEHGGACEHKYEECRLLD